MHWRILGCLVAAIAVSALAASACGGGEEEEPTTPTAAATPTPQATIARTPILGSPEPSPAAPPPGAIDLATTPPLLTVFAAATGELRNDKAAVAVGDFNGDGIEDLLMGAPFGDGPNDEREDAGEAYVVFGSPDLAGTVDAAKDEQDLTIWGDKSGDRLGFFVASGDLNGDGIDDIIVSSPFSNGLPTNIRTDVGAVYVIFGSPDLGGTIDTAEGQQDVGFYGAEGLALTGDFVTVGDVNGDGIDDMIIGAPFGGREPGSPVGGPRTELGEVYVVFGSSTLSGTIDVALEQQDFKISGAERLGELGDALASGDVNGDGIDDIIAIAEAAGGPDNARPNAGTAHVFFGSRDLTGIGDMAKGEEDLTILGAEPRDTLGFSAASGDVNGDGFDDIILTARLASGPGNSRQTSGEVYVILGSSSLGGTVDVASNQQDITIYAADANDLLGFTSSRDVNGDGIDDIILGTSYDDGIGNTRQGAGGAYVIFGSETLPQVIDLSLGQQNITVSGTEAGDGMGSAVTAGDLNGDGSYELVAVALAADGPDNSREDAGEVYVIPIPASE